MRVPAVAIGINQTVASAAVYGSGAFGCAVAGLLSVVGHRVRLFGDNGAIPTECDLWTQSRAHYTSSVSVEQADDLGSIRSSDVVVVAVPATEYGAAAEDLAGSLSSGQTVFIMGAAFGASLEIAHIIERSRRDLAINLVEVIQPFSNYEHDGRVVRITGLRDRLVVAGRTLNETRAGLSVGGTLLNGLVPASNIIDRAFAEIDRWLETAAILFNSFDRSPPPTASPDASMDFSPTDNANIVVAALRTELEALAKAYGVKRIEEARGFDTRTLDSRNMDTRSLHLRDWKHFLARRVIEDYVILASLARLAYMPAPLIESVIELASVLTNSDLRREARQLTDLGMVGMDAKEIIEHISA